jgi:hypothetical protein
MEEELSTKITFDDNPEIIKIDNLAKHKAKLWWSREELREFKSGRRDEVDALFMDAVKKYQHSVYRNLMRDMRIEMTGYEGLSEEQKDKIREDYIDMIRRESYEKADVDFDWDHFQASEYFKEYERLRRKGGRKRSITRRKKRRQRRTKRRTRK